MGKKKKYSYGGVFEVGDCSILRSTYTMVSGTRITNCCIDIVGSTRRRSRATNTSGSNDDMSAVFAALGEQWMNGVQSERPATNMVACDAAIIEALRTQTYREEL